MEVECLPQGHGSLVLGLEGRLCKEVTLLLDLVPHGVDILLHFTNFVELVTYLYNTSLAAKGALANRLQNPKWPPGGPKMAEGVWKGVYP